MSMIHEITARAPRNKKRTRKGRGEGSGQGKTAGRGTKGSGARTGKPIQAGHEGGQTRIYRRLPTRGFSNADFERNWHIVNLSDIESRFSANDTVDATTLADKGLIPDSKLPVKILGDGELTKKLQVVAGWYSKSAHKKIVDAGGSAQNLKGAAFEFPKPKKKFIPREQPKKKIAEEPAAEAEAKPDTKGEAKADKAPKAEKAPK